MVAGRQNFTIEQDATFSVTITYKDSSGTPYNITSYTAKMTIDYTDTEGSSQNYSLTQANGGALVTNGAAGQVSLLIPASTTKDFDWTNGQYDLQIKSPTDTVTRLLQGNIVVSPAVTFIL